MCWAPPFCILDNTAVDAAGTVLVELSSQSQAADVRPFQVTMCAEKTRQGKGRERSGEDTSQSLVPSLVEETEAAVLVHTASMHLCTR